MSKIFKNTTDQVDKAAKLLGLDEKIVNKLTTPQNVLIKQVELIKADGTKEKVDVYRVQFSDARGPFKGGIRFHPQTDLDEIKTLGLLMAIKCAVVGIPMGGGKGGATIDPKKLSQTELEDLSRAWIRAFKNDLGPDKDVPAPDVYTTPQIMAWMADEYAKIVGHPEPAVITGKPLTEGGSEGRDTATAQGAMDVLEELAKKINLKPGQTTVAIQGFGNAGYHMAQLVYQAGYKIIALSDSKGGILDKRRLGMDPEEIMKTKEASGMIGGCYCKGSVCDCENYQAITNEELLEQEVEALIPAALENQITPANLDQIKAKVILEIANGAVDPTLGETLASKNIVVVPDVLTNAGGVTVSYFEWYQNKHNEHWTKEEVFKKLKETMIKSFNEVWSLKEKYQADLRLASYLLAIQRIVEAMKEKGRI